MEMESVLKDIGVVQDTEGDIFLRMLKKRKEEQEAAEAKSGKKPRQRLSLGAVTNSIIEGTSVAEDPAGEDAEEGQIAPKRRERKKVDNQQLNELIMKAVEREAQDDDEDLSAMHSSIARCGRSGTSSSSTSKRDSLRVPVTCPSCGQDLQLPRDEVDEQLSQHMSLCAISRRPTRAASKKQVASRDAEEDDILDTEYENESSADEDSEKERRKQRRARNKLRTRSKARVSTPAKDALSSSSSGSEEETADVSMALSKLCDDWEDADLQRRLDALPASSLETMETTFGAKIYRNTWTQLFPYQQAGVEWLHELFLEGIGGILADEMGLGKTAQTCAHFCALSLSASSLVHAASRRSAFLVVCPATVLRHWLDEMHRWAPTIRTVVLHSVSPTGQLLNALPQREVEIVLRSLRRSAISSSLTILTTYEGLRKHQEALSNIDWTAVCLDEGQKIRNPNAEISAICKLLPSFHRVILSGTPIQNRLRELWSLFDFVYPGRLGSLQAFEQNFSTPIRQGGYANATKLQFEVAVRCASTLQAMVRPFLLRRRKDELTQAAQLPNKTEHVLCCQLSEKQRSVYRMILRTDEVRLVLENRIPAFRAINTLRKLCNHPDLVFKDGQIFWQIDSAQKPLSAGRSERSSRRGKQSSAEILPPQEQFPCYEEGEINGTEEDDEGDVELRARLQKDQSGGVSWHDSGKMLVLSKILPLWKAEGHKVLIFSQTQSVLDLLQAMLEEMQLSHLRLDGSTSIAKRPDLIARFNRDDDVFAMLVTTRTGGVGISLTAANRVILFDPDWNPMTDIQARERAWRIGQKRDVVVYRLVCKGTIEEKIYQRQIFKLLISNRVLESSKAKNLFVQSQLRELFELNDNENEATDEMPSESKVDFEELPKNETPFTEDSLDVVSNEISVSAKNDGPTGKDHLLLKALFDGDAIVDVYNHEYIDPSARHHVKERSSTLEKCADEIASIALKSLQSSARVFQHTPEDVECLGGHVLDVNNSLTSSSLLASIRAKQQAVSATVEETSGAMASSSSARLVPSSSSSSARQDRNRGVPGAIRSRLTELFSSSQAAQGLATSFILSKFQDLGEQYAPVLRSTLRDIAKLQDGKWFAKNGFLAQQ